MLTLAATLFMSFWISVGLSILIADVRAYRRHGPLHTRPTTVAELEDGCAGKLVGTVRLADAPVKAPVTGRACAAYVLRVAARNKLLRWKPVHTEQAAGGFYLDDGTGEVFVPLENAQLLLGVDARKTESSRSRRTSRNLRRLLRRIDDEAGAARVYRCDEGALVDGNKVAVYGTFRKVPDSRPSEAEDYRSRAYRFEAAPGQAPVFVSDDRAALG